MDSDKTRTNRLYLAFGSWRKKRDQNEEEQEDEVVPCEPNSEEIMLEGNG